MLRGVLLLASGIVVQMASALVLRVLLARFLGLSRYADFAAATNWVTVLSKCATLGVVPSIQYHGSKSEPARPVFLRTAVVLATVAAGLVTLLVAAAVFSTSSETRAAWTGWSAFRWMLPCLPVVIAGNALAILLVPWNRNGAYSAIQLLPSLLVPLVLAAQWLSWDLFAIAIVGQCGVWVAALGLNLWNLRGEWPGGSFDATTARKVVRFGIAMWPQALLGVGSARIVVLIGGFFIAKDDLGQFLVGLHVSEALFAFHAALGQVLLSRISARGSAAFDTAQRSVRLSVPLLILVASAFLFAGQPLTVLLFGADYETAWSYGRVLLLAGAAHALGRTFLNIHVGVGQPHCNTRTLAAELLALAVAAPVCTLQWGAFGLACGCAAAAVVALGMASWQAQQVLQCRFVDLYVPRSDDWRFVRARLQDVLRRLTAFGRHPVPQDTFPS